jgi:hypothetical protein
VWAAAKEHLIVAYFCGDSLYFCHIRNLSIPPPRSNFHKSSAHRVPSDLATRRIALGGKRSGGSHTPVVVKFPLFSTKVKISAFLPPSLEFLLQKSTPGIASDVATRRVALERAPEGHRRGQRWWWTTSMVSDSVSQKKISRNVSGKIAIFVVTLA